MKILKFGGSSLANAEKILHVSQVIKTYVLKNQVVVVVSAIKTVTDSLIELFYSRDANIFIHFRGLYSLHKKTLNELGLTVYLQEKAEKIEFAKLSEVRLDEPLGSLKGPENIVVIKTERYLKIPWLSRALELDRQLQRQEF